LAGPAAGPNGSQIFIDGFSGGAIPPKESIREIRINQNPFSAEYDKLGMGRIEILTKPGTDHFRGTLFLNDGNGVFNARNPYATNKPGYSNTMFGGNLSGPLGKRGSFFLNADQRYIDNNAIIHATELDANNSPVLYNLGSAGAAAQHLRQSTRRLPAQHEQYPRGALPVCYHVTR
jgi:hypothetical protein